LLGDNIQLCVDLSLALRFCLLELTPTNHLVL
jgi:hypothetical protein